MGSIVSQLLTIFAPIIADIIAKHQAANNGSMPTTEEIRATFDANFAMYVGEGSAWRAAHPNA